MRWLSILVAAMIFLPDTSMAEQMPPSSGVNQIPATGAPITLEAGKGTLIRLPRAASTVFVANPDIADVQVKSPMLIYLSAKQPGETVIYAVDASDNVLLRSPVDVQPDLSRVRLSLSQLMPNQRIGVSAIAGNVVLSGTASSADAAQKARALATSILGEAKNTKVINEMVVATPNQVNLRVRIDEVDRTVLKELGINWQKFGSTLSFLTTNPTTVGAESQNSLRIGRLTGQSVSAELDALAQEGFVTSLAEPNLTAMNGQKASFLAGGEFPVPISSQTSNGTPTLTVDFKEFGVSLAFTPTIIDDTHLNLKIEPEVSELSSNGAVSVPISGTATITIPALTVRRAQTTVELGSGESFALAGLLQHTSTQDISKVPGLGDIPVLGALFRSDRFQRNETELVIIVTPYLVNPVQTAAVASPLDGLTLPHDMQRILTGSTNRQTLPAPPRGPLGAGGQGLIGPAGFRLN